MSKEMKDALREWVVVNDSSVFRIGEVFKSYEEFLARLEAHSRRSFVFYSRRDSRKITGATKRIHRRLDPGLIYYSAKYTCVHGGNKFLPRGKGFRHTVSMRFDCPSHISIRVGKCGHSLEVISVCNTHNHPVSEELYKKSRQDRRLSPAMKQQVLDLHLVGASRNFLQKYIKLKSGQILSNKDLINVIATNKKMFDNLKSNQIRALFKTIKEIDIDEYDSIKKDHLMPILNYVDVHEELLKDIYKSDINSKKITNEILPNETNSKTDSPETKKSTNRINYIETPDADSDHNGLDDILELVTVEVVDTAGNLCPQNGDQIFDDEMFIIDRDELDSYENNVTLENNYKNIIEENSESFGPLADMMDTNESNDFFGICVDKENLNFSDRIFDPADVSVASDPESRETDAERSKDIEKRMCCLCGRYRHELEEVVKLIKEKEQLLKEKELLVIERDRVRKEIVEALRFKETIS